MWVDGRVGEKGNKKKKRWEKDEGPKVERRTINTQEDTMKENQLHRNLKQYENLSECIIQIKLKCKVKQRMAKEDLTFKLEARWGQTTHTVML